VGGLLCVVCFYLCMGVRLCVVHVCICDCVLCVGVLLSVYGLLSCVCVCYDHVMKSHDCNNGERHVGWGGVGCLVI
jgi:hypothetical protein